MDTFYHIAGMSGPARAVTLYHTNKHLTNFHWDVVSGVELFYKEASAGAYLTRRGYQNGYGDVGYMLIIVDDKPLSSSDKDTTLSR